MQTEINPSNHYKKAIIMILCKFSQSNNDKPFDSILDLFETADYSLSLEKIAYVALPHSNLLNQLAEKAGTVAASHEVNKIESEYTGYDISAKGFIEDIEAAEKENTKRIEIKELENEHIQWLEEELARLNEEFGRRTQKVRA